MQISELQLRQLISSLLIEGPEQDRQSLIKKYPDSEDKLRSLPVKFISWLWDRFGDNTRQEEVHPFEDAIVTVVNFAKSDSSIGAKWKSNEQFKKAVEEAIPERRWATPTDIKTMTADEMETIIGISQRKKQRFDVQKEDTSFEGDRVGKVGPWNLWMPTTKENSCKIAQYDPVTMQPKTTWCTARTSGSNLFYNYIGGSGKDVTLFYIIKDDPKNDNDWLSVGFVDGKPVLNKSDGGFSVNRKNKGLDERSLRLALGANFSEIMNLLTQKNKQLGGKHPAAKKIEEAGQSVEAFEDLVKGLSKEERHDLTIKVLGQKSVSQELLIKLAADGNSLKDLRASAIRHPSMPAEVLKKMADEEDFFVKEAIAANPSTPVEVLKKMAMDDDWKIREAVANNSSSSSEVLMKLAGDRDLTIRAAIAKNSLTSPEVLMKLTDDSSRSVRYYVANNSSSSSEALMKLAGDENWSVREAVANNSSSPSEALMKLTSDDVQYVRDQANKTLKALGLQESLLRRVIRQLL